MQFVSQTDLKLPLDKIVTRVILDIADAHQINIEFHDFAEDYIKFKRAEAYEIYIGIRDIIKESKPDFVLIISPLLIDKILGKQIEDKPGKKRKPIDSSASTFLDDIEDALKSLEFKRPTIKGKITKNELAIELRQSQAIYTSSKESHLRQYFYQLRRKYKDEILKLLLDRDNLDHWLLIRKHKIFSRL